MIGVVVPETCSAYKKHSKIISGIYMVSYSSVITMMHGPINIALTNISYTKFWRVPYKNHAYFQWLISFLTPTATSKYCGAAWAFFY